MFCLNESRSQPNCSNSTRANIFSGFVTLLFIAASPLLEEKRPEGMHPPCTTNSNTPALAGILGTSLLYPKQSL
jgi:hypothetical protein